LALYPFGELPVLAETIPDFELVTWHGVMVPARPEEVLLRLNREIQAVLGEPDIRLRFADGGLDIKGGRPKIRAILKRDYAKYGKILTGAGIKRSKAPGSGFSRRRHRSALSRSSLEKSSAAAACGKSILELVASVLGEKIELLLGLHPSAITFSRRLCAIAMIAA